MPRRGMSILEIRRANEAVTKGQAQKKNLSAMIVTLLVNYRPLALDTIRKQNHPQIAFAKAVLATERSTRRGRPSIDPVVAQVGVTHR